MELLLIKDVGLAVLNKMENGEMKRKLLSTMLTIVLVLSFSVLTAFPVMAASHHVYPGSGSPIQDAIDNAEDGDVIYVHAGTYSENILINGVDVRLIAVGAVTIDGATDIYANRTIAIYNSNCTIDGFTVKHNGVAIYARGMSSLTEGEVNVTIINNYVTDYIKNGITVNGDLATGRVFNNTILGDGPLPYGFWAQNGIQFGSGASGIIQGNTVSNNWYTGGYWTSANILLNDTSNVRVNKNSLYMGQTGIYVWGTNNRINNNYVEGQLYGPYPADWPPQDPPQSYYDYGSWGLIVYGDDNKVVNNTIDTYDEGIEIWLDNNKVITNKFIDCVVNILDEGLETKIHANIE